jgi:hypothetical protein
MLLDFIRIRIAAYRLNEDEMFSSLFASALGCVDVKKLNCSP